MNISVPSVAIGPSQCASYVRPWTSISLLALLLWLLITGLLSGVLLAAALGLEHFWPSYQNMLDNLYHPAAVWRWIVGDISEVMFYKHEFASLGLLGGAALAYWAAHTGKSWQGFALGRGSGRWPWVMASGLVGLLLGNLLWGWTLAADRWQPTFVAFASLPAATVLLYGGGWRVVFSGALSAALLVTPLSVLAVQWLCLPLEWPRVVGQAVGMALGSVAAFSLFRRFPQLVSSESRPVGPACKPAAQRDVRWVLRRALADFSEAAFMGNEWASLGLIGGVLLAWSLNPLAPAYGSGWLLEILTAQALAAVLGVLRWRREWAQLGWYPSYVPLVSVVPSAVLLLGGEIWVIVSSAVLGALIAPPMAASFSRRLPAHMHESVGCFVAMILSVLLILPPLSLVATWQ